MFRAKHHTTGILLVLCSSLILSGCATAPTSSSSSSLPSSEKFSQALAHYSQGLIYENERNFEEANRSYERAIDLDPSHEDSYFRAASNCIRMGAPESAVAFTEQFLAATPSSTTNYLWAAKVCFAAGERERAEQLYLKALKRDPGNVNANIELAMLLISEQREEDAIALIRKALKKSDQPAVLIGNLGAIYLNQARVKKDESFIKRFQEIAAGLYEDALRHHPNDPMLLQQLGDIHVLNNHVDQAIDAFSKWVTLEPKELAPRQKLAYAYIASGQEAAAVRTLEEFAAFDPENSSAYFNLGDLYLQTGDRVNAKLNFKRAAEKQGDSQPIAFMKLALLQIEGKEPEAKETLSRATEALPEDVRIHEMFAYYLLNQEDFTDAVSVFEKTAALFTKESITPQAKFFLYFTICAQRAGESELAVEKMIRGLEDHPDLLKTYSQTVMRESEAEHQQDGLDLLSKVAETSDHAIEAHSSRGLIYNRMEEYELAVNAFETVVTLHQEQNATEDGSTLPADVYFWYGAARERLHQYEEAENLFQQCILIDETHSEAYNYLAYMWAEQGIKLDQAELYIGKALSITPGNAAFLDTLGWIFYQRGQYQIARKHIEQSAEIIPNDPTIIEHLGDVAQKQNRKADALRFWQQSLELDPSSESVREKLMELGVELPPISSDVSDHEKDDSGTESEDDKADIESPTPLGDAPPAAAAPLSPEPTEP